MLGEELRRDIAALVCVTLGLIRQAHADLALVCQEVAHLEQLLANLLESALGTGGIEHAKDAEHLERVRHIRRMTPVVGDDRIHDGQRRSRHVRSERAGGEPLLICDRPRRVGRCTRETSVLLEQVGQAEKILGNPHWVSAGRGQGRRQLLRKGDGLDRAHLCHRFSSTRALSASSSSRKRSTTREVRAVSVRCSPMIFSASSEASRPTSERREICAACFSARI